MAGVTLSTSSTAQLLCSIQGSVPTQGLHGLIYPHAHCDRVTRKGLCSHFTETVAFIIIRRTRPHRTIDKAFVCPQVLFNSHNNLQGVLSPFLVEETETHQRSYDLIKAQQQVTPKRHSKPGPPLLVQCSFHCTLLSSPLEMKGTPRTSSTPIPVCHTEEAKAQRGGRTPNPTVKFVSLCHFCRRLHLLPHV